MRIRLGTIRQSPFVGVFSIATEKAVFVPRQLARKEMKMVQELFDREAIQTTIANSSLLGVLAIGNKKGLVLPDISGERESQELEKAGFKVKRVGGAAALGNLIALNDSKGVCSTVFSEEQRKELQRFLSIDLIRASIAGSDLVGASCVATNKGFLIHPKATEKEFKAISRHFGKEGQYATANHADPFIGNSVVANSEAALVGLHTTSHELSRIDEGLGG